MVLKREFRCQVLLPLSKLQEGISFADCKKESEVIDAKQSERLIPIYMAEKRECRILLLLPFNKPQEGISFAKKNLRSLSLLGLACSCQTVKRGHAPCLDDGFTAAREGKKAQVREKRGKQISKSEQKRKTGE